MNYCAVDAVTLVNRYEDNSIGLDNQNDYQRILPLVRVQPDKANNLDDIFGIIVNKPNAENKQPKDNTFTQQELYKLDSFGTALACTNKLLEAQCCFEKILSIESNFLKSYQNLDNVKNQLVERWHFGMLNDAERNNKYKAAIKKAIQQKNQVNVLDIGTGTGLLALYAQKSGASQIFACEQTPLMCHISEEVFRRNGCNDQIKLIPKHSTDLSIESDLNGSKVDLIVTETMDCGVFGEGLLKTLIHAKENLLKSNGVIIPGRVKLFVAGFQSRQLATEQNVVNSSSFTDTIYVQNLGLTSNSDEIYDSCHVEQLSDFKLITKSEEALNVNLNNLDELYSLASGQLKRNLRLAYIDADGLLDGFCVWFEMSLDADDSIVISTDPFNQSGEQQCCWECAIFRLKHRFSNSQKLQNLNVTVSCENGVLQVDHYYDAYGKTYSGLSSNTVKFLNDTDFINRIEYDVFAEIQKRFAKESPAATTSRGRQIKNLPTSLVENVLDFLPCPTVGLALLKEHRLKTLYCSKDSMDFVSFIAETNCIRLESIVFIDDPADILFIEEKFDLIILPLIDPIGTLISSQIANYKILKDTKLTANGFMVPERVEIASNLIQSNWLRTATRITDPEILDRLQIGSILNDYATTLQLDLYDDFNYINLTDTYRVADVQLNDAFYEIEHTLYVGEKTPSADAEPTINNKNTIHGVLFHFNIQLTASSKGTLSTKRKNSFSRLGCFAINENNVHRENGFIKLKYRQNSGVFKIDLK